MEQIIVGIDIGGTSAKMGILNMDGDILHKWDIPTDITNNGENIVGDIWDSLSSKLLELNLESKIIGIGAGAPGFVNKNTGFVYEAVNIGWKNFELGKELEAYSNLPVFVENDANLAALGEYWKGAGNQAEYLIAITLGTGVGSGIIVDGSILSGFNGTAAEMGHITADPDGYDCNCGRIGCLDTIASGTGIVHQAMDMIAENPSSSLAEYYSKKGEIKTKDIFYLANDGDELCNKIIERTSDILGILLANAATLINPSKILIGGGVSKAGDQLLSRVKKSFQLHSLQRISNECEVKIAELGNDAGMIGAAYLVKKSLEQQ